MNCERYEEMIALDVGGDLPAADAARLEEHLRTCATCHGFAAEMRASREAVTALADVTLDDNVFERVRAGVRLGVARQETRRRSVLLPARGLALAALLLTLLGAAFLLRSISAPAVHEGEKITPVPPPVEASPAPTVVAEAAEAEKSELEPVAPPISVAPPDVPATPPSAPTAPPPLEPSVMIAAATLEPQVQQPAPSRPESSPSEPTVIKLVSEEADLVIYWLVDLPENTQGATTL